MPFHKSRLSTAAASGTLVLVLLLVIAALVLFEMIGPGRSGGRLAPASSSFPTAQATGSEGLTLPFNVYFTNPEGPAAEDLRGGPDAALAEAIDLAQVSVDVAIHDLDLWSLRDALLRAYDRGVTVRLVVESDNLEEEEIQELIQAGIRVLGDRREGLMHDKFVVIDRQEVWTGSMNFTLNDAYRNTNNLIRIRSIHLAEDYTTEFEEMFLNDLFGPKTRANTPYPVLTVDGVQIEVLFSPDDGTAARLEEILRNARQTIHFLAYSFTSDDLAGAILERAKAGVLVAGVMDEGQSRSNQGTEFPRFRSARLDVRLDGRPGNLHDKVLIIDGQIVVTGSYNFSRNAEEVNDENTLIIHSPEIAAEFEEQFRKIFEDAKR